jgi:hypothetical protein
MYLKGLNDSMFQEAVEVSGVDRSHLSLNGLTASQRASDLLNVAEVQLDTKTALYEYIEDKLRVRRKPELARHATEEIPAQVGRMQDDLQVGYP